LTQEEIDRFRARLCEAAIALFATQGYEAVTMRAIAEAMGCSRTLPYRYFEGKEEIFLEVRARCFEQLIEHQRAAFESVDGPIERIHALGSGYLEFARDRRHAFAIMYDLYEVDIPAYPKLAEVIDRAWRLLAGVIGEAIDAGELDGATGDLSRLLWSGIHGIATLEHGGRLGPGPHPADALMRPMIDALIQAHRPAGHPSTQQTH
jgi:AcrR family transcriptional regulator